VFWWLLRCFLAVAGRFLKCSGGYLVVVRQLIEGF